MAPFPLVLRDFDPSLATEAFKSQWIAPGGVFSLLLLLGGDVVARALAQLVGSRITPVAFSFGWVAYAVSAVLSACGENKLMPIADCACQVIHGETGYVRNNTSWVIGRIVRDFDYWTARLKGADAIKKRLDEVIQASWEASKKETPEAIKPAQAGLCVSVFVAGDARPGHAGYDGLFFAGFATATLQLGVAAIPCGIYGDWSTLLVTAAGTMLSFATGSLPQWTREKWACRRKSWSPYVLIRGNGSQHAIVILSEGRGLDLEDLASGILDLNTSVTPFTRSTVLILSILWVLLLVTSANLQSNSWFLLAAGGIGILENLYVAGHARTPDAFGIPLDFRQVIAEPKVMNALYAVEEAYPRIGKSMRDVFFPGELRDDEVTKWKEYEDTAEVRANAWSIPADTPMQQPLEREDTLRLSRSTPVQPRPSSFQTRQHPSHSSTC